ncbi:MAG: hypothetical protein JO323_22940 [Acidobacteriia bacterium]|nr:hypothetical protein [Terriglobia bacterium]
MNLQKEVNPAFERLVSLSTPLTEQGEAAPECRLLDVSVVFTSAEPTVHALKKACALAGTLAIRISLIVPQVVPYQVPLHSPPVLIDFQEARLRKIAALTAVETTVSIYLCRDRWEALKSVLKPHSLVVLGGRRRWWPTPERRLARKLRRAGHEVIVTELEHVDA